MKSCTQCKEEKPLSEFRLRNKYPYSWCKPCELSYRRRHDYQRKLELKKFLFDYLSSTSCKVCNTTDVLVLEFDHIEPNAKLFNISRAISGKDIVASLDMLKDEIAKCDVMCRNCHQRKTHEERKSWRWLMVNDLVES